MAASKGNNAHPELRVQDDVERALEGTLDLRSAAQLAAGQMRDLVDSPALRRIREMQEQMAAFADPPYLRELRATHEQIQTLFGTDHMKGLADVRAIAKLVDPNLFSANIFGTLREQFKLLDPSHEYLGGLRALMSSEQLNTTIARSLLVDDATREALVRSAELFASFKVPNFAKELQHLSGMSLATSELFGSLYAQHGLADLLRVHDVTRSLVEYETCRMNSAYAGFAASIASRPEWLSTTPEFLIVAPADCVFSQTQFVRAVTTHEVIEERSAAGAIWMDVQDRTLGYVEAVLPELSPKLMKAWEGVWDAARRRGPDWARHAGASLRFVLIEALDAVAPLDDLTDIPKQYMRDGKPGRPAQVYWLCAPLQNRTYARVARADLESAISIIDAMSEAVHRDDYVEIEDAFDTLVIRAAVALSNLLKLWKARN